MALAAAPLLAQQAFDFKSLDKLDAIAKNKTKVTLDGTILGFAAGFLGNTGDKDADSVASMIKALKGVYVRTYEFDKDGQYNAADVEPFRQYLKQQQWNKIVESQEGSELSEVYIQPLPNGQFGGVAIVSLEPRELTVVYINGTLSMSDLQKLQGNMGIPSIDLKNAKKGATDGKKKDEDEGNQGGGNQGLVNQ
jgi:hypothetical protein